MAFPVELRHEDHDLPKSRSFLHHAKQTHAVVVAFTGTRADDRSVDGDEELVQADSESGAAQCEIRLAQLHAGRVDDTLVVAEQRLQVFEVLLAHGVLEPLV